MAFSKPTTTADAERLRLRAELNSTLHSDIAQETVNQFLTLPEKSEVGTGGELTPIGEHADNLPGFVDTVRNPIATTLRASMERIKLTEKADAYDLSFDMAETIDAKNSAEKALAHQMAAAHVHAMKLLEKMQQHSSPSDQARLANASAKLMTAYQGGLLALKKFREGGQQRVTVVHQHVQVAGGQVAVAGTIENGRCNDKK